MLSTNVEAQVLTSAEGKQLAAEKDAEWAAKEQKKKDTAIRRKEKENDREQQQRDQAPDAPFTGSLSSKSKPDLQEIAGALSLGEDGTKEVLIHLINTFFGSHPHIRDSEGLQGYSIVLKGGELEIGPVRWLHWVNLKDWNLYMQVPKELKHTHTHTHTHNPKSTKY